MAEGPWIEGEVIIFNRTGDEGVLTRLKIVVLKGETGDVITELQESMAIAKPEISESRTNGSTCRSNVKLRPCRESSKCVSRTRSISTLPMAFETHSAAFGSVVFIKILVAGCESITSAM